jgi:hypothetical protein
VAPATALRNVQAIAIFGIALVVLGVGFITVATLRKIIRTGATTTWSLAQHRSTKAERRLGLVGPVLLLAGMALLWAASRLR